MKNIVIILFIMLSGLTGLCQNFKEYYFKFNIENKTEISELTRIISIDNVINDTIFAYATDKNFKRFKSINHKHILISKSEKSLKAEMATTTAEMTNWNKYPTYDVYVEMMNNYASSYPAICKVVNIGPTVNGRDLLVLKITDNISIEENEPEFFYTSTMHGDETTGMVLMLRLIDSLLTGYGTVADITNLIDSIEIYINPNANPDGTYAGGNDIIGNTSTRSNANGIDLNRNFPDAVIGSHPDGEIWQPETEAMMDFADQHRFVLSGNFHGGIELVNYPWDHTSRRHPDDGWFINLSRNYATSCQNNSPAGYFDDENNGITNGADWYIVYGSRQDYYCYFHNSREVTFEISTTKLVSSSSLPDYWDYNKLALLDYMEECLHGVHGTVKDTEGNSLDAMIKIESHDTDTDSSMVFTDPDNGDYHRLINPETYTIIASANGYYNDTVKNIVIEENKYINVNFILKEDTISLFKQNTYKNNINIFPNPFYDHISIYFSDHHISQIYINIYKSNGEKIFQSKIKLQNDNIIKIDGISNLPYGIYFIQIITDKLQFTKQIVKQ